jgi:type I restriction enzyme, S subunit
MSDGLPRGWASTTLGDLFNFKYGKGLPQEKRNEKGSVRVYGSNGVVGIHDEAVAKGPAIIIGRKGSVGEVHISHEACWPIDTTYFIDEFPSGVPPEYWALYLKSLHLGQQEKSSAIPGISRSDVYKTEVPIPPMPEQRRIVAKLEKLLDKVNACQRRLAKIPITLKHFRQSVLAAACSGRLTADWREENPKVDPTEVLIREDKFKLGVPEDELAELPDKWAWVPLGNYGQCSRGRFSIRPRNDPTYFGGPHPFIQIGDLPPDGGWIRSHDQTLNEKGLTVSKKFPKGTVVIAIVGATIGNTGVLAYDMCFTDSMVGIETDNECGNRYVEFFLRSKKPEIRQTSYSSGGQPNINLEVLNPYPFALPPFSEQKEIVRRVDGLFALADQIEARFLKAKASVDQLTQSVLTKAFRGELVPQNPNDEPASVLLERIRAVRTRREMEMKGKQNRGKIKGGK